MNVCLIGGKGFLGSGLQKCLSSKNIGFTVIDKDDFDLSDSDCIKLVSNEFKKCTHLVVLASKLGSCLFENDPDRASQYNLKIHKNIIAAIQDAYSSSDCAFDVTYYSSSELFWSQNSAYDLISENTQYKFDFSNPRHLYSYVKYIAEKDYFELRNSSLSPIRNIKILRPFNVYGVNQHRGVVYDMIKSSLSENVIRYADDTTRTMTDIKFASEKAVDAIMSTSDAKMNLVDDRCSVYMQSLAEIIADVLDIDCNFIRCPPDKSIRYRNTSFPDDDLQLTRKIMAPHIRELADQIERELQNEKHH